MDTFDSCDQAIEEFDQASGSFADTAGDWIDGSSDTTTFGDVVTSGIDAASEWIQMDTTCSTDSSE